MKKLSLILLTGLLSLSLASCGDKEVEVDTTKTFDLVQNEVNFSKLGEYKALECKYGEDAVIDVKYSIDNADICDLLNGVVIAKNFGEAKVTATYKIGDVTKTDTCNVKVNEPTIDTTKTFEMVKDEIKFTKLGQHIKLESKYDGKLVEDVKYTLNETLCCEIEDDVLYFYAGISSAKPVIVTATYKIGDVTKTDTCNVVSDIKFNATFSKFTTLKNEEITPTIDEKGNKVITMKVGDKIKVFGQVSDLPIENTNEIDAVVSTYSKNLKILTPNPKNGSIIQALSVTTNAQTVTINSGTKIYFPGYEDANGVHYFNMSCKTQSIKIVVVE